MTICGKAIKSSQVNLCPRGLRPLGFLALGLAEDVALGLLSENPSGLQSTPRGRLITLGTTLGHRFTWLPPRLFHRLSQLVRVMARVGARAGQAPESRCSRSPLGAVQEGRQQAPDRPFQWRRSQYGVRRWTIEQLSIQLVCITHQTAGQGWDKIAS